MGTTLRDGTELPDRRDAAFVSAGAVPWDEVYPLVGQLTGGLPGSVTAEVDAQVRLLEDRLERLAEDAEPTRKADDAAGYCSASRSICN